MRYIPGGYSWLGFAPESDFEEKIEKIEDQIFVLKSDYEKTKDAKIAQKIQELETQIAELKKSIHQS